MRSAAADTLFVALSEDSNIDDAKPENHCEAGAEDSSSFQECIISVFSLLYGYQLQFINQRAVGRNTARLALSAGKFRGNKDLPLRSCFHTLENL